MGIFKRYPTIIFGLAVTGLFLWSHFSPMPLVHQILETLELSLYDVRMGFLGDPAAQQDIVIIDIDEDSIAQVGRWPWARSELARSVRKISSGDPKVIALDIMLSEPQESSGIQVLGELRPLFSELNLDKAGNATIFTQRMDELQVEHDHDRLLAEAMRDAGNVILPVAFGYGVDDEISPEKEKMIRSHAMNLLAKPGYAIPHANKGYLPISEFMDAALAVGHINPPLDSDGKIRKDTLFFEYKGFNIPSFALAAAAAYRDMDTKKKPAKIGAGFAGLGDLNVPIDFVTGYLVTFKGGNRAFRKIYSYVEVMKDSFDPAVFKDRLVLYSISAEGLIQSTGTPTSPRMPMGVLEANIIWSILNNKDVEKPMWNEMAQLIAILAIGLIITFILPWFKALWAALVFILLLSGIFGSSAYFFVSKGQWITIAYPLLELVIGYIGIISLQFFVTESGKEKVEGESAETNRMLGLSFQSQGMLDMAFDKFRKVPVDKGMKDVLYSLAQDYERKRQFNKAATVYEYIEKHDSKFKDVSERKRKMIDVGETIVWGTGGPDRLLTGDPDTKPTLGRYEIIKQLGKGAMGIVYLGQDPRINRTTAIKTFQFTDEADEGDIEELKKRFFQEAESAGTLNHPNIVTIYDAGEEQEMAYIAMEYLEGVDLKEHVKENGLPSVAQVVDYMVDLADALNYAHEKGIVHRDIKPANLMLLSTGVIKITDFGIARITASSQTQTGVVKGTPHYMSPEQISGLKVDGRSDIFSLGVVMYQLLTGELPFNGENVATLMHQIIHEAPLDPRKHNPDINKYLVIILNKALQKDREKRYQTASQMASDLRKVAQWMSDVEAKESARKDES